MTPPQLNEDTGKGVKNLKSSSATAQCMFHVRIAFTRNITARVEYLYYDLGDKTYTTNAVGPLQATAKAQFDGNIIRAGVNYKF